MIRDAVNEDIEILLPLGEKMHKTSPFYGDMPFDKDKVREYAQRHIDGVNNYFRVYERDGTPVAFFLGHVVHYFFNWEVSGRQGGLFTDGKTPMLGIRMSKDFEAWCKERGAFEVNYGVTHSHTPRYDTFMSRLGYKNIGAVYSKRLRS